ncbi:GTP 3',8-cyclase MoaA [Autumnicola psychrophila]|uniref:GTP 3',8-cyclase n=1 Tax=Autumnicola psychrophila TaxID=3075592 RepID=A0ABU3DW65_9FLAO|nr:GTP 3',8-cyclase MoaA [Zunongwangia sp. F225]MDT0687312.1 GTP 3',8-cyclase MoaA [Zunongwangia sp. F225]
MIKTTNVLNDSFGRKHNYLRISLIEKCNLRCDYCMPAAGIPLTPKKELMNADEILEMAKIFVSQGVDKIRLTGGEPLVRKDFADIVKKLATLPVRLSITTNAILADRFIETFHQYGLTDINVSLDTLETDKFKMITRRDQFKKAYQNIQLLINEGFNVKINAVLMQDFNKDEIVDFLMLTRNSPITVRFIEFMPFDGNRWNKSKLVTEKEILEEVTDFFGDKYLQKLEDEQHFTSRNYKIEGFTGKFGIISSVTNPFCSGCNRIRLTANGKIKNCLFSNHELDLLTALREGRDVKELILKSLGQKKKVRAGMDDFEKLNDPEKHNKNRSMISIGG